MKKRHKNDVKKESEENENRQNIQWQTEEPERQSFYARSRSSLEWLRSELERIEKKLKDDQKIREENKSGRNKKLTARKKNRKSLSDEERNRLREVSENIEIVLNTDKELHNICEELATKLQKEAENNRFLVGSYAKMYGDMQKQNQQLRTQLQNVEDKYAAEYEEMKEKLKKEIIEELKKDAWLQKTVNDLKSELQNEKKKNDELKTKLNKVTKELEKRVWWKNPLFILGAVAVFAVVIAGIFYQNEMKEPLKRLLDLMGEYSVWAWAGFTTFTAILMHLMKIRFPEATIPDLIALLKTLYEIYQSARRQRN